jgi:glycosyltransferase involved in cell wall biosynthesis
VSESPGKLSFGTYGFTRYDKGLDVLQSSLRFLLSEKGELPDSNFFIQWTSDYRLPDGTLIEQDPILNRLDNITYIPEFNSSEDYYNWIARTDIMLLPYRRGFYRDKLSRVAIDAALAGIPIIYPKGTWLEGFVANHAAGVSFEEANPKSLAVAIEHSVRTHNELKGLAISRQEKTASFFSAKSFFKEIAVMTSSSHY